MTELSVRQRLVVGNSSGERHNIRQVEGVPLESPVTVRVLAEGNEMLLVEVEMPPGEASPPHVHDHESVGYLVRGAACTVIDGVEHRLEAGDGFRHPPGVVHSMVALDEGAVWLEVKSPPSRTW